MNEEKNKYEIKAQNFRFAESIRNLRDKGS